jgi:pimeloyl-[acyl-carrier protein] methyl ester esterase
MTPPRCFLPGWCLGRGPLHALASALDGEIIDLPGYGDAPLMSDFQQAAQDIARRLPVQSQLCGWSLGAQLALAIAAQAPEKVSKLVLIAGTASFIQRDGWPQAMPPEMLAEFAAGVAADIEAMLPRFIGGFNRGDAHAKAVTLALLQSADPRPPTSTLATGLDWLRDVDLRPMTALVKAPTLLIHGTHDPLMPLAAAQALADQIPNARLSAMADCAHAPFASQPEAFIALLSDFLHE